jgi:hypothetical protein
MHHAAHLENSPAVLNRSIDRFLIADGWRVTDVTKQDNGYDVTLTQIIDERSGHIVTRHGGSAGEATLRACSSARSLGATATR